MKINMLILIITQLIYFNIYSATIINPDRNIEDLNTKLIVAVKTGNKKNVEKLLAAGADPNIKSSFIKLVNIALNNIGDDVEPDSGAYNIAKLLIQFGAEPDYHELLDYKGCSGFIDRGIWVGPDFFNKIHLTDKKILKIKLLIKMGVNIDTPLDPITKDTLLMEAASRGHIELVKILLHAGADISIKNNLGFNALRLAQLTKNFEIAKLLENETKRRENVINKITRRHKDIYNALEKMPKDIINIIEEYGLTGKNKELSRYLPTDIINIITEYEPVSYEDIPLEDRPNIE